MRKLFVELSHSRLALLGAFLTTFAAVVFLCLFAVEWFGIETNVYIGIVTYMVVPMFFIAGLALIPLGLALSRRRARKTGMYEAELPVIDLNKPETLRTVLLVSALTLVNILIVTIAVSEGVHVMDSPRFCGTTCHHLMEPEYTAYQGSPHARVPCVGCHVGSGIGWFARSKIQGAWQLVSLTFDLYEKPIPTPIHGLRPARDICERCHWPTKFVGDRLKVLTRYAEDETNTELKTVLLLRVGGVEGRKSQGIHWHVAPENKIRFRTDLKRETIFEVEQHKGNETVTYKPKNEPPATLATEWREMDCVDCHNRPTHVYRPPDTAVDEAMQLGQLPTDLPFLRREALRIVQEKYPTHEAARAGIAAAVAKFYGESYPELVVQSADKIAAAGKALGDVYCRNVFPLMNVQWNAYPNHIGHKSSPGCWRCHDEEHADDKGNTISQDCSTCHSMLAEEEKDPKILTDLNP